MDSLKFQAGISLDQEHERGESLQLNVWVAFSCAKDSAIFRTSCIRIFQADVLHMHRDCVPCNTKFECRIFYMKINTVYHCIREHNILFPIQEGSTPLYQASFMGNTAEVEELLKDGASVNQQNEVSNECRIHVCK